MLKSSMSLCTASPSEAGWRCGNTNAAGLKPSESSGARRDSWAMLLTPLMGEPLIVRSACRRPEHNRAVGGATRSNHPDGAAYDIAMANHDPVAFEAAAREAGFLNFGLCPRSGFIHVDLGLARQRGERFPVRQNAFAAETPPVHEVLAESRTTKASGAAGVATVGAASIEVAQNALAETHSAILPLAPYLDTLR